MALIWVELKNVKQAEMEVTAHPVNQEQKGITEGMQD